MSVVIDLRQAARSYLRSPAMGAALILTVAIGAGGNAAILAFIGGLSPRAAGASDAPGLVAFGRVTVLLLSTSALVLLLASATVAGLLLSRASARILDTAVRVSLGATRSRLALQCFVESLLIALAGGLLAGLAGWWASHLVPVLLFAEDASQMAWSPNARWLGATTVAWIVVITACGVAPAVAVSQRTPVRLLSGGSLTVSGSARRFRTRLVIGQIAVCVLLVDVAGVIRDDLHTTMRTSRGQIVGSLLVVEVEAAGSFLNSPGGLRYFAAVQEQVRRMPGVIATSWIGTLPTNRAASQEVAVEPPPTAWRDVKLDVATFPSSALSPGRFKRVGGRLFGVGDGPDACRVVIINREAADQYFGGDAIGRSLKSDAGQPAQIIGVVAWRPTDRPIRPTLYYYADQVPPREGVSRDEVFYASQIAETRPQATSDINVVSPAYFDIFADPPIEGRAFTGADGRDACRVGIVNAVAERTLFGGHAVGGSLVDPDGSRIDIVGVVRAKALGAAERAASPMIFMPLDQAYQPIMRLALRTTNTSLAFRSAIEATLGAVPGGRLRSPVETMEANLARTSLAPEHIASALVGVCTVLALAVSLAGVYAVMADQIARRRRELALRIAFGASAWRLIGEVAREGLRLTAWGEGTGLAVVFAGTPLVNRFLVHSRVPSPLVLLSTGLAVCALVTLSSVLPAWQALRVDPREAIQGG